MWRRKEERERARRGATGRRGGRQRDGRSGRAGGWCHWSSASAAVLNSQLEATTSTLAGEVGKMLGDDGRRGDDQGFRKVHMCQYQINSRASPTVMKTRGPDVKTVV